MNTIIHTQIHVACNDRCSFVVSLFLEHSKSEENGNGEENWNSFNEDYYGDDDKGSKDNGDEDDEDDG